MDEKSLAINIYNEEFSKGTVDNDVHTLFLPLNIMQTIVLTPKYQIKNNIIKPNSATMNFITFLSTASFIVEHWYNYFIVLFDENMKRYQIIKFLYFASTFDILFATMGFTMISMSCYINSRTNVEFLLTFQKVHRFLNNEKFNVIMIFHSWIHVCLVFSFYISCTVYMYFEYLNPPWYTLFHMLVLVTMDTDCVYAIRVMRLIVNKLELWNRRLFIGRPSRCWCTL